MPELVFGQEKPGKILIDGIIVPEQMQRKGMGSRLFDILIQIITVLNSSEIFSTNYEKIDEIDGELQPYDPPFDQYEKSVPFYEKKSEQYGFEFILYETDGYLGSELVEKENYVDIDWIISGIIICG